MIDLDERPAAPRQPAGRNVQWLPWVLLGLVVVALALSLATTARPVISAIEPAEPLPPTIVNEESEGIGLGVEVRRDVRGRIISVMDVVRPFGEETVWCRLTVNDVTVEDTGEGGAPAVCLWVRGADS